MSEARIKQLEGDVRVLQSRSDQYLRLQKAVRKLYSAGYWSCDRLTSDEAKAIFIELRDSAGIKPGESPVPVGLEGR
jgi:hypothetical protein